MPNLRVISDNAIDRAVLSASSTAGNFNLASLQSPRKSDVWRAAAGATARLGATWATPELLQAVVLAFCDLSPTATMRVRVTSEGQATNLLRYSEQFDNPVWTLSGTVTPNAAAAPDGTATADSYTQAGSTTNYAYLAQTAAGDASQVWTYSLWVKVPSGTATIAPAIGNVTVATRSNAQQAVTTAWQRLSFTLTAGQLANTGQLGVGVIGTPGQVYHVWGAQLEAGPVATSYYPTTSAAATRPLGYIDSWQGYTYDSGTVLACPAPAVRLRGFTAAQSASAYAFGGGAHARHWITAALPAAYGLAVDISDPANLTGSIEASFLVAGPYWESVTNFDYGASAQLIDSSKNDRNDAGDLISDAGTVSQRLSIPMSKLAPDDRTTLWNILRAGGTRYPVFASMFPGDTDLARERDHQVLGKLVQLPAMSLPFFNLASASIEVESI